MTGRTHMKELALPHPPKSQASGLRDRCRIPTVLAPAEVDVSAPLMRRGSGAGLGWLAGRQRLLPFVSLSGTTHGRLPFDLPKGFR